jgi:hypothetical protein
MIRNYAISQTRDMQEIRNYAISCIPAFSQTGEKLRNREGIRDTYLSIASLSNMVLVVQKDSQTGEKLRNREGIRDTYLSIAFLGNLVLVVQTDIANYSSWQLI